MPKPRKMSDKVNKSKYRKASHVTYDCRYHLIWITKFRRKVLDKKMKQKLEEILRREARDMYVKVIRIGMEEDHVHMYISIPVSQPIPYVVQQFKGVSSNELRKEFKEYLRKFYWQNVLWAVGYFVATVGEVSHELIQRYVESQGEKDVLGEPVNLE